MHELVNLGLVTIERQRVWRMIGTRLRSVLGETRYTVHREAVPKNHQKAKHSSKVDSVYRRGNRLTVLTRNTFCGVRFGFGSSSKVSREENNHRHQSTPRNDEDDRSFPEQEEHGPVDDKAKNLPPELRSWMRTRILARGRDVRNVGSYLKASMPAFVANLAEEVESFLVEKAVDLLRRKRIGKPLSLDQEERIYDALKQEAIVHQLPNRRLRYRLSESTRQDHRRCERDCWACG